MHLLILDQKVISYFYQFHHSNICILLLNIKFFIFIFNSKHINSSSSSLAILLRQWLLLSLPRSLPKWISTAWWRAGERRRFQEEPGPGFVCLTIQGDVVANYGVCSQNRPDYCPSAPGCLIRSVGD